MQAPAGSGAEARQEAPIKENARRQGARRENGDQMSALLWEGESCVAGGFQGRNKSAHRHRPKAPATKYKRRLEITGCLFLSADPGRI